MKFFFKCLAVFLFLNVFFILLNQFVLRFDVAFSGILLFSGVLSIGLTIIFGWIDDVLIHKRQPELEKN
jgi:hypothetical protein